MSGIGAARVGLTHTGETAEIAAPIAKINVQPAVITRFDSRKIGRE